MITPQRLWMSAALLAATSVALGIESLGIGKPQDDTYAVSFQAMQQVATGKILALCECEAIPNPDTLAKDGPQWLYCLPWWGESKRHPAEWIKKTYPHEQLITLDELPKWKSAPCRRQGFR